MTAKSRPILFGAPMLRAIIAGEKTVTRLLVKPTAGQRRSIATALLASSPAAVMCTGGGQMEFPRGGPLAWIRCPYGAKGNRLWARETAFIAPPNFGDSDLENCVDAEGRGRMVDYAASMDADSVRCARDSGLRVTTAIHMPRWASRLTLEVVSVGCERVKEITDAGAVAEGASFRDVGSDHDGAKRPGWSMKRPHPVDAGDPGDCLGTARFAFGSLWKEINGDGAWDANPHVWVVEFKRVEA